ncbi:UPF0691 protein [Biomphalaria glabrata]|uniref:Piercer of microtubule wall 1 protein-like n=1 Tax=Biomphalaria glabrata TaxID=6526 RepID=A0A9U8DV30_BIOGL|nr:piercer of microtubule wall 1 protein-like [Biomphalaria glabrata]KAI8730887.1 hypothetical protein BgiMline_030512 [Biomphalaria glabrata]KAI8782111.1 UPF0691 protein C9orf116 [Biomphalaria glabrata]
MESSQKQLGPGGVPLDACTSDYYRTKDLPYRFEHPNVMKGYGQKPQHPMYTTEASKYGSKMPSVHTMPLCFHAKSQKFSDELGKCGMPRNFSLNTSMDKSII